MLGYRLCVRIMLFSSFELRFLDCVRSWNHGYHCWADSQKVSATRRSRKASRPEAALLPPRPRVGAMRDIAALCTRFAFVNALSLCCVCRYFSWDENVEHRQKKFDDWQCPAPQRPATTHPQAICP